MFHCYKEFENMVYVAIQLSCNLNKIPTKYVPLLANKKFMTKRRIGI